MNAGLDLQLMEDIDVGIIKMPFFSDDEWEKLQDEIIDGFVNVNKHPDYDLWIYNYTPKTQYDWHWNDITIRCRGLILDAERCLVAKGFDKFFTHDQLISDGQDHLIPTDEPYRIYDKVDGSLGVMYFWEDQCYISTRGSFESEMAIEANKWLRNQYGHIVFYPEYSYLFEIIYPENRIVVDYGSDRKLVLLAVIDNTTMREYDIYDPEFDYIEKQGLKRVKRIESTDWKSSLDQFKDIENIEGVVVHFLKSNFRVKMKLAWYKNLSYVMQHFTKSGVWKMVRDGKDVNSIIADVPDELYPMVKGFVSELYTESDKIESRIINLMKYVELYCIEKYDGYNFGDKEYYEALCLHSNSFDRGLVMAKRKNKDIFKSIWRSIKPMSI